MRPATIEWFRMDDEGRFQPMGIVHTTVPADLWHLGYSGGALAFAERWLAGRRAELSGELDVVSISVKSAMIGHWNRDWYRIEKIGRLNRESTPKLKVAYWKGKKMHPVWVPTLAGGGTWILGTL